MGAPKGATIVKAELDDEAGKKLRTVKKDSSFSEFIAITKKAEEESLKPLSGDYEVLENVSKEKVRELRADKRSVGWNPKTRTALVLKLAFLAKKAKLKKGE